MKKVYFIGICGAGMGATANLMQEYGYEVSGSDEGFYPPISTYLEKHKIPVIKGYKKENIPKDADLIIIGKHAGLTPDKNEEVKIAFDSGIPVKSFAEVLGEITQGRINIVVAGSYGKSTCSAIVAWCLEESGKNPGYFIGAVTQTPRDSSKKGIGEFFILEGDEYPSANWDEKSKFLHYHSQHLLLTSLAHDHINIFKTHEEYKSTFRKLVDTIPENGLIVACKDGESVSEELHNKKSIVFYSVIGDAEWQISNFEPKEVTTFDITQNSQFVTSIKTSLLGIHNAENILGAGALLLSLKAITPKEFSRAVESFKAPERRLDRKSDKTRIPVFEGFGSSYDKVRSAIEAIKVHFPDRKVLAVFEPHTFGWRDRASIHWYDNVFQGSHEVFIYKPPTHGAESIEQLGLSDIVNRVNKSGLSTKGFNSPQEGLEKIKNSLDENVVILILSSGGFDGLIGMVEEYLNKNFPK